MVENAGFEGLSQKFVLSEWTNAADGLAERHVDAYAAVLRIHQSGSVREAVKEEPGNPEAVSSATLSNLSTF